MWILMLNDMRSSNIENLDPVARAETREQLEEFIRRETVPDYVDDGQRSVVHSTDFIAKMVGGVIVEPPSAHRWGKAFRKGGPLEWFNPPGKWNSATDCFRNVGTEDDWAEGGRARYRDQVLSIEAVGDQG